MDNTHGPLGILGGGQLGRMLALAAHRLGIKTVILDPLGADSPAGMVTRGAVAGHFRDANAVEELAARCKVVTYEIEHINVDALDKIASSQPTLRIEPPPSTLRIIQDKYAQKKHLQSVGGVPMGDFRAVEDEQSVLQAGADWGYPLMLKAKRLAYDGRGNAVVKDRASARAALESLGGGAAGSAELYVERWVPFERELACVVARSSSGQLEAYPVVHTVQKLSMCHTVVTPANSALPRGVHWAAVEAEATRVAQAVVGALPGAGVFGVELFMTADGTVLFNEVAPRVHNSGHYTQDACACDQFEMHVRRARAPRAQTRARAARSQRDSGAGCARAACAAPRRLTPSRPAPTPPPFAGARCARSPPRLRGAQGAGGGHAELGRRAGGRAGRLDRRVPRPDRARAEHAARERALVRQGRRQAAAQDGPHQRDW